MKIAKILELLDEIGKEEQDRIEIINAFSVEAVREAVLNNNIGRLEERLRSIKKNNEFLGQLVRRRLNYGNND